MNESGSLLYGKMICESLVVGCASDSFTFLPQAGFLPNNPFSGGSTCFPGRHFQCLR
jgi:hypothetical protein